VSNTAGAAHLPVLSLRRWLLTDPSKPALHVNELRIDAGVSFAGSTIQACTAECPAWSTSPAESSSTASNTHGAAESNGV